MHRQLARQLRKCGLDAGSPPDAAAWAEFLAVVDRTYGDADQDRYTLERSLAISSDEMQAFYQRQKQSYEARLRTIFESIDEMIWLKDPQGAYLACNPMFERFVGMRESALVGRKDEQVTDAERAALLSVGDGDLSGRVSQVIKEARTQFAADGRSVLMEISVSAVFDTTGNVVGILGIGRDIGERRRKAALLQLLESLARATNEAITPELAMQECIERVYKHGGWKIGHFALFAPQRETTTEPVSFWHCEDRGLFGAFIRHCDDYGYLGLSGRFVGSAVRERRPVWIDDISRNSNQGRLRAAKNFGIRAGFVFPVFVRDELAGFLEFFDTETREPDIDLLNAIDSVASQLARLIERSRAESALAALNAELEVRVARRTTELETLNRELNAFSYMIAHDLRAPVRAMNGFSELVLNASANALDARSLGYLKRVIAGSRRMGELIDDLLDLARLSRQELKRDNFNLSEMAFRILTALVDGQADRNVEIIVQPGIMANADPGLIHAVLENLIGNAWKFTGKNSSARIEVNAVPHHGSTVYRVSDNGAGFEMNYVHKLFEPFQRLHHTDEFEGTGIGLATVKKIIGRHGGEVWIESAVNEGTTVSFTLGAPVKAAQKPP